ncbi:MAG: septal ring lytic transglycosylase RlpA family protein [Sediminibacterium sp.]|jgi:rare lipoprotein A|nr:septal ring lytic transglycosylase RlpA family protein [Sediminibacterium sp.]
MKWNKNIVLLLFFTLFFWSCSRKSNPSKSGFVTEEGQASFYADKFEGRPTASGETFQQRKLTAAHKTLPFGTEVKVTNLQNKKSVLVKINDRGPFVRGRIIDLSRAAAQEIDMIRAGVVPVKIEYKKQ